MKRRVFNISRVFRSHDCKKEDCVAYGAEHGEQSVENFDKFHIHHTTFMCRRKLSVLVSRPPTARLTYTILLHTQDTFFSITNVENIKTAYVVLLDTINHETMLQIKKITSSILPTSKITNFPSQCTFFFFVSLSASFSMEYMLLVEQVTIYKRTRQKVKCSRVARSLFHWMKKTMREKLFREFFFFFSLPRRPLVLTFLTSCVILGGIHIATFFFIIIWIFIHFL